MDKITNFLKHLDLSDGEAKIYLTLLRSGALSVRELASKTEIKRTTAYLYLDQLIEKGLIVKVVKKSHKMVAATEPEDGLNVLAEQKLEAARTIQNELPDVLKTIIASASPANSNTEAEVKYYKGKSGVKKIYEEALKAKEIRSYGSLEILRKAFPENEALFLKTLKSNNIKIFEILEDSPANKEIAKGLDTDNDKLLYKYLPQGVKLSAVDTLIYDGKVSIISASQQVTGVIFNNNEYYTNSKELFDVMWKTLSVVKI